MPSPSVITNKLYSLDGNIGSGKSTLLRQLKERLTNTVYNKEIIYVDEPVDEWCMLKDSNGESILEKFYKDQKKYSFSFQMMAYISRLTRIKKAMKEHPNAIIITERCVRTDKHVFAQMLYDDGLIEEIDFKIYLQWFEHFIEDIPFCGIIYVNTKPEICYERIAKRNRNGESTISLEYLKKCDKYHQKYTKHFEYSNVHALYLDGNVDMDENKELYDNHIHNVRIFVTR